MSLELTKENMILFFPSHLKPLSDIEISDFINTPYQEEMPPWPKECTFNVEKIHVKITATKKYNTKKEIRQEIKTINDRLDRWLEIKYTAPNEITKEFCEININEDLMLKEVLQKKLRYSEEKFNNNDLLRAKEMPLEDFLEFNSAGFAKCIWHQEKTGSLHKIKGKNRVYCFGCSKSGDVVDVVMEINKCTLPEALKIILRK